MDSPGCADKRRCPGHSICEKRNTDGADTGEERRKRKRGGGKGGGGAGVALHASHSIRRSRVCPVHVDVSLRASVAGERQELPRA